MRWLSVALQHYFCCRCCCGCCLPHCSLPTAHTHAYFAAHTRDSILRHFDMHNFQHANRCSLRFLVCATFSIQNAIIIICMTVRVCVCVQRAEDSTNIEQSTHWHLICCKICSNILLLHQNAVFNVRGRLFIGVLL